LARSLASAIVETHSARRGRRKLSMTPDASAPRAFAAAYAGAHLGKSVFWYTGDLLFVFFLTEFGGLDARSAGLVLGAALAFSAVADLLVAKLLGPRIASTVSAARLQLIGTIACAATFVMFALTAAMPIGGRLIFACAASLMFRAAYAVIDVPQNAILGLAATTDRDRTRLAGLRIVFSGVASLLVSALAGLLIASLGRSHAVAPPVLTSAALGALAVLGAAALAFVARRRVADLALPGAGVGDRPAVGVDRLSLEHGVFLSALRFVMLTTRPQRKCHLTEVVMLSLSKHPSG